MMPQLMVVLVTVVVFCGVTPPGFRMASLLQNLHLARHHATAAGSGTRGPGLPGVDAMGWTLMSVTIPLIMEWRTAGATVLVQLSHCAHPLLHTAMATF